MKKEHLPIWIKLRAETIKHFHDTHNKDKFIGGYPLDFATILAEHEIGVVYDNPFLDTPILSIDEMLLLSLDECVEIAIQRNIDKTKELLKFFTSL
jgi:hypothetical protein